MDKDNMYPIYLEQPNSKRTINMTHLITVMPEDLRRNILLIHAITGCDTTSFPFGIGKTKLFKTIVENEDYDYSFFKGLLTLMLIQIN